jgi:hypothetical protein
VADQLQRYGADSPHTPAHLWCGVMRKFLLGTAALIVLAGPAVAADMRGPV